MVITSVCGTEDVGSIPTSHISIRLKALGPSRAMLGRRGTVRFGYLEERDGSMTPREKTYAWELEVEPARGQLENREVVRVA